MQDMPSSNRTRLIQLGLDNHPVHWTLTNRETIVLHSHKQLLWTNLLVELMSLQISIEFLYTLNMLFLKESYYYN